MVSKEEELKTEQVIQKQSLTILFGQIDVQWVSKKNQVSIPFLSMLLMTSYIMKYLFGYFR